MPQYMGLFYIMGWLTREFKLWSFLTGILLWCKIYINYGNLDLFLKGYTALWVIN